jgi:hypothetical protein
MPRLTIQKLFLIACIVGLMAATASVGHAEKPDVQKAAAQAAKHHAATGNCHHHGHGSTKRVPVHKRYLKRIREARHAPRRG